MEYRTPISPNAFGSSITSGTASRTSRKNDSPADSTGLQNIPSMYYEAATLDGGSKWQVFRHVTLPLLTPAMSTAVIQNVIGGLKLNDVIISLTKGGPTLKTHSLSTYISYMYFDSEKAGYASAIGVFLFAFIFIISTFLTRYFRKREVQY